MNLPFTVTQFVGVFAAYNRALGLMPLLAYALGALALYAAVRSTPGTGRIVPLVLSAMWAFTGIAYHLTYFAAINPGARLFGIVFVAQAVAFAVEAFRGRLHFEFSAGGFRSWIGVALVAISMALYPLIGMLSGHGYPNGPVFGLTPCPLVIFTFGMLLLSDRAMPKYLVVIPLLWALIGSTAAFSLGIREDVLLLISGLVGSAALLLRRSGDKTAAVPTSKRVALLSPTTRVR